MAPRSRAENRAELTRAILERAGAQLADVGPAALSVRQVARDLDLASSAVYRYYPSRDALLTALIVEAYGDLADRVEAAERAAGDDLLQRWRAVCHAVRDWAVASPHRYALLYGSPVPGYVAPADTVTPAARIPLAMLRVAQQTQSAGLSPAPGAPVPDAERAGLAPVTAMVAPALSDVVAVRATLAWGAVFGTLSLELFGHMQGGILDTAAHFDQVVDQLAVDLGLEVDGR